MDAGSWPSEVAGGVWPPGIHPYFMHRFAWEKEASIGGNWDWEYGTRAWLACLAIVSPARTDEEMAEIDARCDDGNLASGDFRRDGSSYVLIFER